jgi:hypothetical protein
MAKSALTKWWIAGAAALIPAGIMIPSSILAVAAHLETKTPVSWDNLLRDDYSRTMVVLIVLGGAFAAFAIVASMMAWIGAVLNTRRLADRRWFSALLWVGIAGVVTTPLFGVGALISGSLMIAYLVGGPDAMASLEPADAATLVRPRVLAKPAIRTWFNWGIVAMGSGTVFALLVSNATDPGRFLNGHVWPSLALLSLGFTVLAAGAIPLTVAWWAALFNSYRLADGTWFKLVLWSGIIATVTSPLLGLGALFGLGVMIAYLHAAPDWLAAPPPTTPSATLAPAS